MPLNAKAKRKYIHYIMKKVNYFFYKRLSPVFQTMCKHANSVAVCARRIVISEDFYGRCPNPQFLKKLSKLFCFWKDNLALAKFQCPTDTPLNYNLPQCLIKSQKQSLQKYRRDRCVTIEYLINILIITKYLHYSLYLSLLF